MPTKVPVRIYWDSCVYISCIQETPSRISTLKKIIQQAEDGEIVLITSTFILAEVVKIKDCPLTSDEQSDKIKDFFDNEYIKVRDLDRKTASMANEIARAHSISPADAVHLATALRWQCDSFQTYDGEKGGPTKLLAFDGKIGKPPLKIEIPTFSGSPPQILLDLGE